MMKKSGLLVPVMAVVVAAGSARAQSVALPEVVVTSPSPIVRAERPTGPDRADPPLAPPVIVDDTFAPVTVVTRSEIDRDGARTLGDLLFTRPGITGTSFAPGGASRPVIRGLDNFRVRIQENGIGEAGVSSLGEDHAVPVDPQAADRVEVVRGPATLRYGSGAIGGVVSATNNRVPSFIPPGGFSARTSAGVSSVDGGRDTSSAVDAGSGNVAAHADWFARSSDDYRTPAGIQPNSAARSDGAAAGVSSILPNGYVGLGFSHFHANYRIPGLDSAETRTRIDMNQDKVFAKGELRPSLDAVETIRFAFGTTNYKHEEIGLGTNPLFGPQATFRNREQEFRLEIQHVPVFTALGTLRGAIGVQLGHRAIGTSGEAGGLLLPTNTASAAIFLFEELQVTEAFRLQAAARAEYARVRGTATTFPNGGEPDGTDPTSRARTREFGPKSASLGALYTLPFGIVASLTGQYAERAPDSLELYSQGAHDAPGTFEIGNADLRKEKAKSIELGFRKADGPWRFEATGYYTQFQGFIYKRLTGLRCGDDFASCGQDDELRQIAYSQQNARFYGAELATQYDLVAVGPGVVGIDGQYDFVRAEFRDGTNVPRIPPHRLGGGLYYRDAAWFARVGLLHAFAHEATGVNETPTAGYDLLKAEIGYTHRFDRASTGLSEATIGLVGNNLLDDRVRNSVSFRKDEVLLPGRDVRAYATVRF